MSWYNSFKDFTGDIGKIASNPLVDAGLGVITGGLTIPMIVGGAGKAIDGSGDPNQSGDKSVWDTVLGYLGNHAGDILKTGGNVAQGVANYEQNQAALKERAREFDAQNQLGQNQQAMTAASQLNRAPLADKGQFLAMNYAAPTAFQPRDYTQGLNNIRGQASGGAGAQLAANAAASANYKPGAGGVDTSTLRMILSRLGATPQGAPLTGAKPVPGAALPPGAQSAVNGTTTPTSTPTSTPPTHSTTTSYGGQQYNADDWQAYLDQHPELRAAGYQ